MKMDMAAKTPALHGHIIDPRQVSPIAPFGLDMKILLSSEETGGVMSVLMAWHQPGEGPPDHLHYSHEETLFVVEGLYEMTVGGQSSNADPGTLVFVPRNTVHRFRNIGSTAACMLDWTVPGGSDRYFRAIAELGASGRFSSEKAAEISKRFDTYFPGTR
jgi:quercetin dioxygenase-like cupin family protein